MKESKNGRQTISRGDKRLLSIALVITFAVVAAKAQMSCVGICEQNLAQCIRNQGNGPSLTASCLEQFDICVENCLEAAGAVLG